MRESSNLDTASNLDNHLIGYERLPINSKETGSKMFSMCVRAMKKLTELCSYQSIYQEIQKIKSTQFKFRDDLQSVSIEDFLEMRECILAVPVGDKRYNIESRKSWLFVF